MGRQSGYYWVKAPWGRWLISYYDATVGSWESYCADDRHNDSYWIKIDERKIERP